MIDPEQQAAERQRDLDLLVAAQWSFKAPHCAEQLASVQADILAHVEEHGGEHELMPVPPTNVIMGSK